MSDLEKQEYVSNARGLAKYFELDVKLKLFGVVIWEYHFPPKN